MDETELAAIEATRQRAGGGMDSSGKARLMDARSDTVDAIDDEARAAADWMIGACHLAIYWDVVAP